MAQVGDIVRFLNAVGGGKIVKIKDNIAYVDDDGFETPVLLRECVVIKTAEQAKAIAPKPKLNALASDKDKPKSKFEEPAPTPTLKSSTTSAPAPELKVDEQVSGADIMNVVLGFEATDITHLGTSKYEAFLVNDSNYYLYFTFLSRSDDDTQWTTRYCGEIEPNIQLLLGELEPSDVNSFDRVAIQFIAFKKQHPFDLKNAVSVEHYVDTTKFFKLHCFKDNSYFERRALVFDIVRDDVPFSRNDGTVDSLKLEKEMNRKKSISNHHISLPSQKNKVKKEGVIEVDLHADELIDTTRGLSNSDILNLQIDKFRQTMDANLKNHGAKIVFIHGKGEGVLRQALLKELNYRYKEHKYQDASFRDYGFGATMVTIK